MPSRGKKQTIFVAMSGGVDSSVAAALLKKQGYNVTGVFMRPWQPAGVECLWKQDREDALLVAAKLDIPLLTWDLSKEYEKYVTKYMIQEYGSGRTPNPDVMCNKFIKFGLFLDKTLKAGADYIATGHYIKKIGNKLFKSEDLNKDQSYFLYTLTQKQLKYCLFPIGDYKKEEIREMAEKFGLPNSKKPDSQGICFIGPLQINQFLKKYIRPKEGLIIRKSDGKVLGKHDGVWFYTIGQRHGFSLSGGKPYYVVGKDTKQNLLYVDENFQFSNFNFQIKVKDLNWINNHKKSPLDCKVKTRYRQKDLDCIILKNGSDKALIRIKETNIPIAPGQAAVFYKGNELLGGGIIN